MPQIQIIGQEKLAARMGERDRALAAQRDADEANYKMHLIDYNTQMSKIAAKNAATEEAKILAENTTKEWDIAQAGYKQALKYATLPNGGIDPIKFKAAVRNMTVQFMKNSPGSMKLLASLAQDVPAMGDPEQAMLYNMNPNAAQMSATTGQSPQINPPPKMSGLQQPNISAVNAISGNIPITNKTAQPGSNVPRPILSPSGTIKGDSGNTYNYVNAQDTADIEGIKAAAALRGKKEEGEPVGDKTSQDFSAIQDSFDTLAVTLDQALNNPRFAQKMGQLSGPNRMFSEIRDPEFTQFRSMAKAAFSEYRKMITGAQASMQELNWLEDILGSVEKDTYDSFLLKNLMYASVARNKIKNRLASERAAYKDVSQYEPILAELDGTLATITNKIKARGWNVEQGLGELGLSEKDRKVGLAMAAGASYKEANLAYTTWKKRQGGV